MSMNTYRRCDNTLMISKASTLVMLPGNPAWGKLLFLQENFSQIPAVQVQVQMGECHPSGKISTRFLQIKCPHSCAFAGILAGVQE
jgi:hypothetical protein